MSLSRTFSNFINKVSGNIPSISASTSGNALTIGISKCMMDFRNTSLSSGVPLKNISVPTLSITVPSSATLGTSNGVITRLVVLLAYNGGNPILCVTNLAGAPRLTEDTLISPTTISSSSNSLSTIYSASTVAANSPFRVVGYVESTQSTAGIWNTPPSLVQSVGGQLSSQQSGFGNSQTLRAVTRTFGQTYFNPTDKAMNVSIGWASSSATSTATVSINGGAGVLVWPGSSQAGIGNFCQFMVPPYSSYSVTLGAAAGAGIAWTETY